MSANFNQIKKNIISAMQSANKQGTSAYDTTAVVRRIEGDIAWVHIAGGVDETPVKLTIAANIDDEVQVRVGGGRAWITGNATAPPTDDATANKAHTVATIADSRAKDAQDSANTAMESANIAQTSAEQAVADAESASIAAADAGRAASLAQSAAEASIEANYRKYNAIMMTASDIATKCVHGYSGSWERSTAEGYYQGACNVGDVLLIYVTKPDTKVGKLLVRVTTTSSAGQPTTGTTISWDDNINAYFWHDSNGAHVLGDTYRTDVKDGLEVVRNSDGIVLADINPDGATFKSEDGTEIAHFGYGETQGESGQTNAPYYDLGVRKANSRKGAYSVAEGRQTTASASYSHAEGNNTTARGAHSHAEGDNTTASGNHSHAEGSRTTASGVCSHAEVYYTTASGAYSHAEGNNTTASGAYSHAEGFNTVASGVAQTTMGKYNAEDTTSALIIGNGTSDADRSNAMTVDFSGNVDIAGAYKKNGLEIGEIIEPTEDLTGNKSVPSSTATVVASITLPKGKYIVQGNVRFNSISSAGTRLLSISHNTTMNYQAYNETYVPANSNGYVNVSRPFDVPEDDYTINLLAYCGSAINVSYRYLKAIRVG